MTFDPNFTLSNIANGFRIFAFEESLNEIPAQRSRIPGQDLALMTVFLHARVFNPNEFNPKIEVMITADGSTEGVNQKIAVLSSL